MSPAKPADVRINFDADVLGLAKLVCQLREDYTCPGDPGGRMRKRERPPCPITTATKDPDWIPLVASNGWLVVTRDAQIQHKRAEIDAVRTNGAKMINLASADAGTSWGQLEVFMTRVARNRRPCRSARALHLRRQPYGQAAGCRSFPVKV